jgi:hypothetical protein
MPSSKIAEEEKKSQRQLLADIELRGGICVYSDYHASRLLDCLFNPHPDRYGCPGSERKRTWQNRTTRWKKLPLTAYLELLNQQDPIVTPHPQTILRHVQIEAGHSQSQTTWFPLSTDQVVKSRSANPPPTRVQKVPGVTSPPLPRSRKQVSVSETHEFSVPSPKAQPQELPQKPPKTPTLPTRSPNPSPEQSEQQQKIMSSKAKSKREGPFPQALDFDPDRCRRSIKQHSWSFFMPDILHLSFLPQAPNMLIWNLQSST